MAKRTSAFDSFFERQHGCKECRYKCKFRDAARYLLSEQKNEKTFLKYFFGILEKPENLALKYRAVRDKILEEATSSLMEEGDANGLMFCFLINAGESFIQKRERQYGFSSKKVRMFLTNYNDVMNSFFSIPVKSQFSVDTEKRLRDLKECSKATFQAIKGPFPGCDEYCRSKCLFRYDVEPFVVDRTHQ